MFLLKICDNCGAQFPLEEIENMELCNYCGKDLCLKCYIEHDCDEIIDAED